MQSLDADVVGLAAYQRHANKQPGFDIVVDWVEDRTVIRMLKAMIRGMTHFYPKNRWSANRVRTELNKVSACSANLSTSSHISVATLPSRQNSLCSQLFLCVFY